MILILIAQPSVLSVLWFCLLCFHSF